MESVLHVRKRFHEVQKFGAVLFRFVGYRHFFLPIVVEAVLVSLLDRFMFFHLLGTVRRRRIMQDVDMFEGHTGS